MRVDNDTIGEMFEVLRLKVVDTGPPLKVIRFKTVGGATLCDVPFDDIEEDPTTPGNFFFQDSFDSRIIRGVVTAAGAVDSFEIYDVGLDVIIDGDVTIIGGGGDITFNSTDWEVGQVVIISSLKIYFPTGD